MSIRRIAEVAAFARKHGEIVTTAELIAAGLDPRIAEPPGLTIVPRGPLLR